MLAEIIDETYSMEDLKIKFGGETNQIEANTLINSLLHFTTIVQEVNKDLQTGRKVEIKVNALPEGSFLVHLSVEALGLLEGVQNIFTAGVVAIASDIVTTVTGIYQVGKFLKGKAPASVESNANNTTIHNVNGDSIVINNPVYNIYTTNRTVKEALSQEFETLDKDSNVTGFDLLDKNDQPLVEITKEEFAGIANPDENVILPDERVSEKVGTLSIYTLSFGKDIKWTFYYEGNKISARISEDFAAMIDKGERFAKGDSLEAVIEVKQQFNKEANTFVNKAYKIIRIIRHIPRSEQPTLDFPPLPAS